MMWHLQYLQALDVARERELEARRHRLARERPARRSRPWLEDVRHAGALAVARLSRRPTASAT